MAIQGIHYLQSATKKEIRRYCLHHFESLFMDVMDLPFWILSLAIFLTIWRGPHLYKLLRQVNKNNNCVCNF
jgi:hypothetical protein